MARRPSVHNCLDGIGLMWGFHGGLLDGYADDHVLAGGHDAAGPSATEPPRKKAADCPGNSLSANDLVDLCNMMGVFCVCIITRYLRLLRGHRESTAILRYECQNVI